MKDKLFGYSSLVGLMISVIGFILLSANLLSGTYEDVITTIYKFTFVLSFLFLINTSSFIIQKFNTILKVIGLVFVIGLVIKFLIDFEEVKNWQLITYAIFSVFPVMYFVFFKNKSVKSNLDYFKLSVVILFYVAGFLRLLDLFPIAMQFISTGLYWGLVLLYIFPNLMHVSKLEKNVL